MPDLEGVRIVLAPMSPSPSTSAILASPSRSGRQVVADRREADRPPEQLLRHRSYCYDPGVFEVIFEPLPSGRGELEITDVNNHYVEQGRDGV